MTRSRSAAHGGGAARDRVLRVQHSVAIIDRGGWAILLLAVRLAITGIGVGAGLALWNERPGAAAFARLAVVLTAGGVLLTFLAPTFPNNRPPGTTAPLLFVLLTYYAAWFAYLTRRRAISELHSLNPADVDAPAHRAVAPDCVGPSATDVGDLTGRRCRYGHLTHPDARRHRPGSRGLQGASLGESEAMASSRRAAVTGTELAALTT